MRKIEHGMDRPSDETITRVIDGMASKEEAKAVSEWFVTAEGQAYLAEQIDRDFDSIKERFEEVSVGHAIPSDAMLRTVMVYITRKKKQQVLFRAAAILLPVILISYLFYQVDSRVDLFGTAAYEEIHVPRGERIQVLFQDGSRAYLNADSRIRYPREFGLSKREVSLMGEAYFTVQPNAKRPFIVKLDSALVEVLGTSFNVKSYNSDRTIDVTLDEGKVRFTSWNAENNVLHPGERLSMDRGDGGIRVMKPDDTTPVSIWKNNIIMFRNEPLAGVVTSLSRWYDVAFVVEDDKAYGYSYTTTSGNTLLEKVLSDLEKVAPVKFSYRNDTVRVRLGK